MYLCRINATVQINTNEYRGFLFHTQAHLVRPHLSSTRRILFSLTQIGNTSVSVRPRKCWNVWNFTHHIQNSLADSRHIFKQPVRQASRSADTSLALLSQSKHSARTLTLQVGSFCDYNVTTTSFCYRSINFLMAVYCSFKGDFQAIVDGYKDNMFTLYGAKRHHVSADTSTAIKHTAGTSNCDRIYLLFSQTIISRRSSACARRGYWVWRRTPAPSLPCYLRTPQRALASGLRPETTFPSRQ